MGLNRKTELLEKLAKRKEWLKPFLVSNCLFGDMVALVNHEDDWLPILREKGKPVLKGVYHFDDVIQFSDKKYAEEIAKSFNEPFKIVGVAQWAREEHFKITEVEGLIR